DTTFLNVNGSYTETRVKTSEAPTTAELWFFTNMNNDKKQTLKFGLNGGDTTAETIGLLGVIIDKDLTEKSFCKLSKEIIISSFLYTTEERKYPIEIYVDTVQA
ncbi:hypothetical protein HHI36_007053, partial [Cryptolaemus montrouzieri]